MTSQAQPNSPQDSATTKPCATPSTTPPEPQTEPNPTINNTRSTGMQLPNRKKTTPSKPMQAILAILIFMLICGVDFLIYLQLHGSDKPQNTPQPTATLNNEQADSKTQNISGWGLSNAYASGKTKKDWSFDVDEKIYNFETDNENHRALITGGTKLYLLEFKDGKPSKTLWEHQYDSAVEDICYLWNKAVACRSYYIDEKGTEHTWNDYFNKPGFEDEQLWLEHKEGKDLYLVMRDGYGIGVYRASEGKITQSGYAPVSGMRDIPLAGVHGANIVSRGFLESEIADGETDIISFWELKDGDSPATKTLEPQIQQLDNSSTIYGLKDGMALVWMDVSDDGAAANRIAITDFKGNIKKQVTLKSIYRSIDITPFAAKTDIDTVEKALEEVKKVTNTGCPVTAVVTEKDFVLAHDLSLSEKQNPASVGSFIYNSQQGCVKPDTALYTENIWSASTAGGQVVYDSKDFVSLNTGQRLAPTDTDTWMTASEGILYSTKGNKLTRWLPAE